MVIIRIKVMAIVMVMKVFAFSPHALFFATCQVKYKGSSRVLVKRVVPGTAAASRPR